MFPPPFGRDVSPLSCASCGRDCVSPLSCKCNSSKGSSDEPGTPIDDSECNDEEATNADARLHGAVHVDGAVTFADEAASS